MSKLHYIAIAAALPIGAFAAWRLGDARGVGLAAGVSIATAISLVGLFAQDRAAAVRSSQRGFGSMSFMAAFAVAFLAKLFALATGAIVLRMHDGLAALADWRSYLVGFAAAVAWVLFVGAFRRRTSSRRDGGARDAAERPSDPSARKDLAHKEAPASC